MKICSRVLLIICIVLGLYAGWKAWGAWMGWGVFLLRGAPAALPVLFLIRQLIFPLLLCVLTLIFGITGLVGTFDRPKVLKAAHSLGVVLMVVSFFGLFMTSFGPASIFLLFLVGVTRGALASQMKQKNTQQRRTPLTAPRPSAPRQTARRPSAASQSATRQDAPPRAARQPQPPERSAESKPAYWRGEDPWEGPKPKDPWDL